MVTTAAAARRQRLATGIYKDAYGISVIANRGGLSATCDPQDDHPEVRYPLGIPPEGSVRTASL